MRIVLYTIVAFFAFLSAPASAQDDFAVPPAPHMEDYYKPGLAPVRADAGADVTIIYFSDYQCPSCRKYTPDVNAVFGQDRKLTVIYRDTPIFGPRSEEAARYAIAAQFQGKHEAFHRALMAQPLPLDDAAIRAAAKAAKMDWNRLVQDRQKHAKAIDAQIAQNQNLAEAAGIAGTPAFIVGKTLANGAMDAAGLRAEIADARAALPNSQAAPTAAPSSSPSALGDVAEPDDPTEESVPTEQPVAAPKAAPVFEPSRASASAGDAAPPLDERSSFPLLIGGAVALLAAVGIVLLRRRRPL